MAELEGISYMRTTREKTKTLYAADEAFPIGGSKVLAASSDDRATLVGAGVTLYECLEAADRLAGDGIPVRVIDAYSIKPIDAATLETALRETGFLVTVEDHWIEGGLGDAVLAALAAQGPLTGRVHKIGVTEMPMSGTAEELREWAGISAGKIVEAVTTLLA
jgi:transketolase